MTTIFDLMTEAVKTGVMEHMSLHEVIAALEIADDMYTNGDESLLTDFEYDVIKKYVHQIAPDNPYFDKVGSSVRGGKIPLPYRMGSLDQIYEGDYAKWVTKYQLQDDGIVVTDKLDGVSVLLTYGSSGRLLCAYSRGDGTMGADVTRHIRKMKCVPQSINTTTPVAIRAEGIISFENFSIIKDKILSRSKRPYKNPRNFMAGFMNSSENPDFVYDYIDVVTYQIVDAHEDEDKITQLNWLMNQGFKVVHYGHFFAKSMTDVKFTSYLTTRRAESIYEIDGLVIEVEDEDTRNRMNPTRDTLNPAYAVKFKVAEESNAACVKVTNVIINVSKSGYLKPTIEFTPVLLEGVTISRCTGFNMKFIYDNKIGPGATLSITRAGSVIPFCQKIIAPMPVECM